MRLLLDSRFIKSSLKIFVTLFGLFCSGILPYSTTKAAESNSEDDAGILVELNKLENMESRCRAYMMFKNTTAYDIEALKLDLVMFDDGGIIVRRLAVEAPPLGSGRTKVRLFDIQDLSCDRLNRILLNQVMTCESNAGDNFACGPLLRTRSKASTELIQ